MTIKIKQAFPRMLLAFGLVSVLLVSMAWGLSIDDLNVKIAGFGKPISQYVREIDNIPADRGLNWNYTVDASPPEINIVRKEVLPGPIEITEHIRYNTDTGEYSIKRSEKDKYGWVVNELWKGNKYKSSFYKAAKSIIEPSGRERKIEYDSDGRITRETNWDDKGRLISQTVYPDNSQIVTFEFDPVTGKRTRVIVKNTDNGTTITSIYGPDGEVAYVTNCYRNGNCKTEIKKGFAREMKQQQQTLVERPDVIDAKKAIEAVTQPGENFMGAKEKLQAEVLQQIEDNRVGDLSRGQATLPAGAMQQPTVIVQPLPVGPLSVGPSGMSSVTPGGKAVELNPQQLPAQDVPTTTKTTNPDGSTTTRTRSRDGSSIEKTTSPDGTTSTTTRDPKGAYTTKTAFGDGRQGEQQLLPDGTIKGWEFNPKTQSNKIYTTSPDGTRSTTETYSGPNCSGSVMGPGCKKTSTLTYDRKTLTDTTTNFGPDGRKTSVETKDYLNKDINGNTKKTTTNFGPDGRPTSIETTTGRTTTFTYCDAPGKCPNAASLVTTQPKQDLKVGDKTLQTGAAQALKDRLKDKAIAVDPKKLHSVPGADQLKDKVKFKDPKVGAKKLQAEVLGQIQEKPSGELKGAKEKLKTGVAEQLKKKPGESVGLNPQPLPPKDFRGITAIKKPKSGDPQPFKEKAKIQNFTVGQKEKLNVTPRTQAAGQMQLQSGATAKQKIQTQAVQPLKGKTKPQDWGSSAGSAPPLQRFRQ